MNVVASDDEDDQREEVVVDEVVEIEMVKDTFQFGVDQPTEYVLVERIGHEAEKPLDAVITETVQPAYQEDAEPQPIGEATINPTTAVESSSPSATAMAGDVEAQFEEYAVSPIAVGQEKGSSDEQADDQQVEIDSEDDAEKLQVVTDGIPALVSVPTVIPNVDKRLDPTELVVLDNAVVTGRVLSGKGLQLSTSRPEVSVVTQVSGVPMNPKVRVVFSPDGKVIDAKILKSTGYKDWDAPLLASLYKWKLSGEMLSTFDGPVYKELTIILYARAPRNY